MSKPDYDPGMIAELLPYAYDKLRHYGFQLGDAQRPEPGMPVGSSDPSKHGGLWCMTADCQRALERLPEPVRRCVYGKYVQGLTAAQMALRLGIAERTVNERIFNGVRDICSFLNGRPWEDPKKMPRAA